MAAIHLTHHSSVQSLPHTVSEFWSLPKFFSLIWKMTCRCLLLHYWFIMSSSVQVLEHELLAHLVPVYHHVTFSLCSVSGCTPMVFNVTWKCYICQNHPHSLSTILDCLLFIFSVFHLTFLFRKTTICYLWYFFPNVCCMRSYLAQASAKEKKSAKLSA